MADMPDPKERPVIFSGPMVRAILDGKKTQTRRVLKPCMSPPYFDMSCTEDGREPWPMWADEYGDFHPQDCPYGQPGDRLWVRETFALSLADPETSEADAKDPSVWDDQPVYRADGESQGGGWTNADGERISPPWHPSIHMPRWASRITLEVTGVRVERVQDISEADARAEGVVPLTRPYRPAMAPAYYVKPFHDLWDSINGNRKDPKTGKRLPYAWADNPWVWVPEVRWVR